MVITIQNVMEILPSLISLGMKVATVIQTGGPVSITDEIKALDAARLKSSQDIIDAADKGV